MANPDEQGAVAQDPEGEGLPWEERSVQELSYLSPPDTPAEAMQLVQALKGDQARNV